MEVLPTPKPQPPKAMLALSDDDARVSPPLLAALLLLARAVLKRLELPHPTAAQVLEATGSSKSRAYELRDRLEAVLPTIVGPVGRPPTPPEVPAEDSTAELTRTVLGFVMAHPGCVCAGPVRAQYATVFRHFVLSLRDPHAELTVERFAEAVHVPVGTLEGWLHPADRSETESPAEAPEADLADVVLDDATDARIQTVLLEWSRWHGDFTNFCDHVRHHCRLPLGNTSIATILFLNGARTPRRRPGRSSDEEALRGSFTTFFAGAQWVGDGAQVTVTVNGQSFTFNLELDVDACSGAVVGAVVGDTEDSAAVVQALRDGVATTGEAPLALLLDNKPCNHTDEVDDALGDTLRIRATLGRAQNKAHVEGVFGLFSQHAPPLTVHADTTHELARQMLVLRVQTWARTLNYRPRKDRSDQSRIELYRKSDPSPEQIEAARNDLQQRLRRQERARQTRIARADPVIRQTLDDAFARLDLADPEEHFRSVIAGYSRDVVVEAIAIFEGKKNTGRLDDGVDARYLLGIVKNLDHKSESAAITESLIRWRTKARDIALAILEKERAELLASADDTATTLHAIVDRALHTDRDIDRHFWIGSAADLIHTRPTELHKELFRSASRRIHTTFRVDRTTRSAAERSLARKLWPLS